MGLRETLKSLKKAMPDAFEFDTHLEGISTGSLVIDYITGVGGFPRRRLSEVMGWQASGKTTLCLMACAMAQRQGLFPAYLDVERGVDLVLAKKIGFDVEDESKGLFLTPSTFEECVRVVHDLVATGEVPLVIVDSVPGMVPKSALEDDIENLGQIGHLARMLSTTLPKLTKLIDEKNVALVLVNQMRKIVNTGWGNRFDPVTESSSGGSALKFYSSLRLNMRLVKEGARKRKMIDRFSGKDIEVPVANTHSCKVIKNKVAVPYKEAEFVIRYDDEAGVFGIDNLQSVIDMAVAAGHITKKGSYLQFSGKNNFSVQGVEALYGYVRERPDVITELRALVGV